MSMINKLIKKLNLLERVKYRIYKVFYLIKDLQDNAYSHLSDLYSYTFLKNIFIIKNDKKLTNEVAFFKKNSFLVVDNFLDKKTVDFFLDSLQKFDNKDFIDSSDLATSNNIFYDRTVKNLDINYNFPEKVLSEYNHVRNCHDLINNAPVDLFATVINKSEYLLNSRVSIEVSEIYETLSNGDKTKTNSVWHHDGDIYKSFKVLIYLNDVGANDGALKIKSKINHQEIEFIGTAGTAIFFKNSELEHLGSLPENKSRWCLNFKVYPKIISSKVIKGGKPFNYFRRRNLFRNV